MDEQLISVECPRCHAVPGTHCRSAKGKLQYPPHQARIDAAREQTDA